MLCRIIDKETKLFKRDDFVYDEKTEEAVSQKCPQGFKQPKWESRIETVEENGETFEQESGEWVEGAS